MVRVMDLVCQWLCFFQAEDGIRDLVRSRGLGDVYKRQRPGRASTGRHHHRQQPAGVGAPAGAAVGRAEGTLSLIHI